VATAENSPTLGARLAANRAWAWAAADGLDGRRSLVATVWRMLGANRDLYYAACSEPLHPMRVLESFFTQLSKDERNEKVPVDPAWLAKCATNVAAALKQLAESAHTAPIDLHDSSPAATETGPAACFRILYVADLHGDTAAYAKLPALCCEHDAWTIVCGGDMLPKGGDMFAAQREFLCDDLPECLDRCASMGIAFFGLFGNDDLRGVHEIWLELVRSNRGVYDLAQQWHTLPGGFMIRGCSWVPDYPFGLKDWCLRDTPDATPAFTRGRSIVTSSDGVAEIDDPAAFFASQPTLEQHLDSLVEPSVSMERAVLVSHAPPAHLGLGMLWSGEDVGSKSVHAWITRHQPLLTLSGHIHESPDVGLASDGKSRHTAKLGRTTCHQPGQVLPEEMRYSIIEFEADDQIRIEWKHKTLGS